MEVYQPARRSGLPWQVPPVSYANRTQRVQSSEEKNVPYTHDENKMAGIYVSNCADAERITMPLGHEFPPCPKCGRAVEWTLVVATKVTPTAQR